MSHESRVVGTLVAYGRAIVRGDVDVQALHGALEAFAVRDCRFEWDGASFGPKDFFDALRDTGALPAMNVQRVLEVRDARGVRWFATELRRQKDVGSVLCRAAPLVDGAARHLPRPAAEPTIEEVSSALMAGLQRGIELAPDASAFGEALRALEHGAPRGWVGVPLGCPPRVRALAAAIEALEGVDDPRIDWPELVGVPDGAVAEVERALRWAVPVAANAT